MGVPLPDSAARSAAGLLLTAATACTLTADVLAEQGFSPLRRPLSELFWTTAGWLFPVALVLLAGGLLVTAVAVRALNPLAACGFGAAGVAGVLAALFPADGPASGSLSGAGEAHRWASVALLVLPLLAGAQLARRCAAVRRDLRAWLCAAAALGAGFLIGFVPQLFGADGAVSWPPADVSGLLQRLLVLTVIAVALVAARAGAAYPVGRATRNPVTPTRAAR